MKKLLIVMTAAVLLMGFAGYASADGYYEFSSFHWDGTDFRGGSDCGSYGNQIFVHNGSRIIDVYTVSIGDMDKRDQTPFLVGLDGDYGTIDDVPNPDYQTRTLTYNKTITLGGSIPIGAVESAEIFVDSRGIFIGGGDSGGYSYNDVLHFDIDGNYLGKAVTATGSSNRPAFLGYDSNSGKWFGADEYGRDVYSSAGGNWTYEFTWPDMSGGHGDGLEVVISPDGKTFVYVSDMTSNFIGQWAEGDNPDTTTVETGWNEWNQFDYAELMGGSAKDVEGMGFGALGHFWVTSAYWAGGSGNAYLYELGGGDIGGYTPDPDPVPEPATMLLLGSGLVGLAGFSRKKKISKKS